jgi:ABC-type lipoprotein export system ATPase subunit
LVPPHIEKITLHNPDENPMNASASPSHSISAPGAAGDLPVLLRLSGLTRSYGSGPNAVHALRGVDLELPRGILAAVKGRSGSGKTTLLNLAGGLDRPTSGSVIFDGQDLSQLSDHALTLLRRTRMGFIFQSFALLPTCSAFENVELVLRIAGYSRQAQVARARRCLHAVGLARWQDHRPDEMSGGQQQRVAIARALASSPDLILADEPTGELDSTTSRQIYALFRRIVETEGLTMLVSAHDPLLDEYADAVYHLEDGVIVRSSHKNHRSNSN